MVLSFNFAGIGPDDLASGLSPFLESYAGAKDYYQAQESASVTLQLDQGNQNASLTDIQAIKANEKVGFPSDLHQTCVTLQCFAVLCQALLQSISWEPHQLVRSHWTLLHQRLPQSAPICTRTVPWFDRRPRPPAIPSTYPTHRPGPYLRVHAEDYDGGRGLCGCGRGAGFWSTPHGPAAGHLPHVKHVDGLAFGVPCGDPFVDQPELIDPRDRIE